MGHHKLPGATALRVLTHCQHASHLTLQNTY